MTVLTGKALKVVIPLDPAELRALKAPDSGRVVIQINVAGRTITADIPSKGLRKTQAVIAQTGPTGAFAMVQGRLEGDTVTEAGLVAQAKAAKEVAAA
jgi:hypothetical protein